MRAAVVLTLLLALAADARAVTIAWTPVGNPGNANDPATGSLYGGVGYNCNIDKYDVTNNQYVAFLNAKDPTGADPLGLYSTGPGSGINYNSGAAVGSMFSVIPGAGNYPVNDVSWYDAIRFANWMNNGQGNGDTETGSYTLLGGTPTPTNGNSITRNAGATIFLPSENEWYKAAYYNPKSQTYFKYPTSSNTPPVATVPTGAINSANYNGAVDPSNGGNFTDVGAYTGTTSPYGAFDMAGNVFQWDEALIGSNRGLRGGSAFSATSDEGLASSFRGSWEPANDTTDLLFGFRVVMVPEPSSSALAALGLIGLAAWGWRRKRSRLAAMAILVVLVTFTADARAVTMAWSPVGNPGNAPDTTVMTTDGTSGYGSVPYAYNIGTYDVTYSQYVAFLNTKDPTGANTLGLYNSNMSNAVIGGINYNAGNSAGSKYSVISGNGNHPVNCVTWYSAIRFANWLNNGQGDCDTETGAYNLLGFTPTPSNGNSITRNAGAKVFLPSENEWYKAAFYNPATKSYFQYPTATNKPPTPSDPTGDINSANYSITHRLTDVGAYTGRLRHKP